jgi:CRISPR-associated endonuclease/helicase Cas3
VLLQRLGRLHRHTTEQTGKRRERPVAFREASATVLVPADGLRPYLAQRLGGRNRHGLGFAELANELVGTYPDLVTLEATRRLIATRPRWHIPAMNRELVERATHDQAIAKLADELVHAEGDAWRDHLQRLLGDAVASTQNAADAVLRRSRPFMDQPIRPEERVTTRLGGDRRLVELPPGTLGAFGLSVTSIAVPGWMIRAADRTADVAVTPLLSDPGFILAIGSTTLRYDVRGLQLEKTET